MKTLGFKHDRQLGPRLQTAVDAEKAVILGRFFKTGPGQYGEGDQFLGLNVPTVRALARDYQDASDELLLELLVNPYHEVRLLGVLIMVRRYERATSDQARARALRFYLQNCYALNNWDLVDLSVYKVWGDYLRRHPERRRDLFSFARSPKLWERRMAVVATLALIKAGEFKEILELSVLLLNDREDLMHKAVGWMLREVGKKDLKVLRTFLDKYATSLPRTALRYAIERLPETERLKYLQLKK